MLPGVMWNGNEKEKALFESSAGLSGLENSKIVSLQVGHSLYISLLIISTINLTITFVARLKVAETNCKKN